MTVAVVTAAAAAAAACVRRCERQVIVGYLEQTRVDHFGPLHSGSERNVDGYHSEE